MTSADQVSAAEDIAKGVSGERNAVRAATQSRLSPGGKALSGALEQPREWADVFGKYAGPDELQTFENIAEAAGRSRPAMTALAKVGKVAGPVGTVVGVGAGAYEVYEASPEERPRVAAGETGAFVGGAAGGSAGVVAGTAVGVFIAAALGLASGPAGWVVLGLGVAGGGAGGYFGSETGRKVGTNAYDAATRD